MSVLMNKLFDYCISCKSIKVRKDVFSTPPFICEMVDCIGEMVNDLFFMVKKQGKFDKMDTFWFCIIGFSNIFVG